MSRTKQNRRFQYANQHASIKTQRNLDAVVGGTTYTANREDDFAAYAYTDSSNSTSFTLQAGNASFEFNGRQARTIQRLLNKHYESCGVVSEVQPGIS